MIVTPQETSMDLEEAAAFLGMHPVTLRELGGWESLEMVQVYAHLAPGHIAAYAGNSKPPEAQNEAQSA